MMTSKPVLHIDLETYSSVDLAECGVYKYAESEDFEILLFAYAYNDDQVTVLDLARGERIPDRIIKAICSDKIIKVAHNAQFERVCISEHLRQHHKSALYIDGYLPPEQWTDTMIMAAELGYPTTLAGLGAALGLASDKLKMAEGKRLIQYFCKPCKPTKANGGRTRNRPGDDPEKWATFVEYNKRDVESEQEIFRVLSKKETIKRSEWDAWFIDQRINDRGIGVELDLVDSVIENGEIHTAQLEQEAKDITGLSNPNSIVQLKGWIEEITGERPESLDKKALRKLLKTTTDPDVHRVLEIRQELGKTSVSKYEAFKRAACKDGRVRGMFQFYGGRTGRWAGRIVQPQNFPRPDFDDLETARLLVLNRDWDIVEEFYSSINSVCATLIRTAIIPEEGKAFVIADYSAIEARVIAWLTGETWRQEVFANGGDIYCASASQMFKVPVVKHGVNGHLRQKGKIAELALGYGGGVSALDQMGGRDMGLTATEMLDIVEKWREASPKIKKYWYSLGRAFENAISGKATEVRGGASLLCYKKGTSVYIKLPSGRSIAYVAPVITEGYDVQYMGMNQTTRTWGRIKTWGGKLTENVVQSIARDCLVETLRKLEEAGIPVVMHVHDEVICEVPANKAEESLKKLEEIMSEPIPWAPGLLLTADGFQTDYYRKD